MNGEFDFVFSFSSTNNVRFPGLIDKDVAHKKPGNISIRTF